MCYVHHRGERAFQIRIRPIPQDLLIVHELGGRIPRKRSFHVNPGDNSLCLGSRLRLLLAVTEQPSLVRFAKTFLIPYLFAVSRKLRQGGDFAFGELAHGSPGELADCVDLFGVSTTDQARIILHYLGMKKRRANKLPCPCGCGKRLGMCSFNRRLEIFRQLAERSWFRKLALELGQEAATRPLSATTTHAVLASA